MILAGLASPVRAQTAGFEAGRNAYVLSCGGCHGLEGVSNSRLVPDLKDQVGFFLNLPQGRAYVARLPNVAFSQNTDEALTWMLNYVVFSLGGASVPKGARPYSVREVAQLRRHPLTEVSLTEMRRQMVGILIGQYNASAGLRLYGEADYGDSTE
jgi:mono/diheme cytochrome c family protein